MSAGATAVYLATQNNYTECLQMLLSAGANPNLGRVRGASAVYMAAHKVKKRGVRECVRTCEKKRACAHFFPALPCDVM